MSGPVETSETEDLAPAPSAAGRRATLLRTLPPAYPDRDQLVAAAKAAVDQRLAIVPCWPLSSRLAGPPERGKWSFDRAIKTVGDCNVGVALGEAEGAFAVVADDETAFTALELVDKELPPHWRIRGARGRVSLLLRCPKGFRVEARRLEPLRLTVVTSGAVLLPPSVTRDGAYSWASGDCGVVGAAPAWLLDLVGKRFGDFDASDDVQAWADLQARRAEGAREIAAVIEALGEAAYAERDYDGHRAPSAPVVAAVEKLGRVVQRRRCRPELGELLALVRSSSTLGTLRGSEVSRAFQRGLRGLNRTLEHGPE